jgi:hypothetical protein
MDLFIRGRGGDVLGRIVESGDSQWGYDRQNNLVGEYVPRLDKTLDKNRSLFGTGNLLAVLIIESNES